MHPDTLHINIPTPDDIPAIVALALAEDVGDGDITAELIPANTTIRAYIVSRLSILP